MNKILKYSIMAIASILFASFFASCNDDDDLSADRLFRPQVNETFISGTYFTLKWDKYEGTESFELALSTDTFKTTLRTVTTDTTVYTFDNLEYDTEYQVMMKSVGGGLESKYVQYFVTTQDYPVSIEAITDADIIDTQVKVTWDDINYDQFEIRLGKKGEVVHTVNVTDEDNQAKQMIISELDPTTSYSVYAYVLEDGEMVYKGKRQFKTAAAQVYEGEVFDVRELSDEESLTLITPEYISNINTNYPDGATIVLKGGAVYNINNAIELKGNITFITGLSLNGNAVMAIDNNFVVPSSSTVSNVRFEKVFFTEGPTKPRDSGNYGGTYVFNFNQSNATLDNLTLESCVIKYKRGVIRSQTQATINNITINNCVIDSIGGYGIVNNDNDNSIIANVKITNSTISHVEKFLVGSKGPSINSILVENVTVCYAPKGTGNYLFDYNGMAIPGGLTVKNSIFGAGWGSTVNGMRSSSSKITFDKCFRASDLEWTVAAGATAPTAPIDDLTSLNKKTTELFQNPDKGDFTIIDSDTKARNIGDPRWLN